MPARVAWTPAQLRLFERKGPKGRRPARGKPKPALERATHIALADLLRAKARPDVFWTALEAGEYRTEKTGALLKRKGVKPGVPDFMFLSARGVAFLELKRGRMGSLSAAQALFGSLMLEYGVPYAVAYGFSEAEAKLMEWGVLKQGGVQPDPRPLRDPVGPGST